MNINQFLALKVGDRIRNAMADTAGTVTTLMLDRRRQQDGVWIKWDGTTDETARSFTKHTTAWMHWEIEDLDPSEPPG